MPARRIFLLLLIVVTLAGCASSRQTTTSREPAPSPSETAMASAPDSTEQPPAPKEATDDWYLLDEQANHFPGASVERAYRTILRDKQPKDTVIVAVIDNGFDVKQEDLNDVLWTNRDEVPGNNEDDDNNGYVDDVHGWNFIGGKNGKNVNHDTFELTRIYARLRPQFEDVTDTTALPPAEREKYARYQTIKTAFQQKKQKIEQQLNQTRMAKRAYFGASQVLRNYLGVDTLTQAQVEAAQADTARQQVRQAKQLLARFYQYDVTPSRLDEQRDHLQDQLKYGYNPDFDPRDRVGDDYEDTSERYYGNNEVSASGPYHGTHVAGIIGAVRDNDIGTRGIAGAVYIMPVRTVPDGDERDKDVANAIRYAANNGADIINMSFGKGYSPQKEAVDAAVRYADQKGVLMVHAAGNEGANIDTTDTFPSKYYARKNGVAENWISVGASSWKEGELAASFSNYGAERVDLFAPGVAINSTVPHNRYERASGTSMAAPVVSGVAALVMSYYPTLSAEHVKDILLTSAVPHPGAKVTRPGPPGSPRVAFSNLSATGGIVNAFNALQKAQSMTHR